MKLNIGLHFVKDGQSLLQELSKDPATLPSLIFLDLNMPKIGGKEVLDRLKKDEHLARIPVNIFSTSAAPAEISMAYSVGASAYFTKPASYEKLKHLLSRITEFYFDLARLPE